MKKSRKFACMRIIEQFSIGKREGTPCEDGWVVTAHFAAVVDGSTAKMKVPEGQESPGHLAMRLVCKAIEELPADVDMKTMLQRLTAVVADDPTYQGTNYRPTCSAVIYSRFHQEVWFIGDCPGRWLGQTYQFEKLVDKILIDMRCRAIRYYLSHGYTVDDIKQHDKGRAFIYDALCDQVHFQNDPDKKNPYAYPVIDGQPIDPSLVRCFSVANASELILTSDGYPKVCDTLEATEAHLADVLKKDPLCIQENPATKCLVEGNRSFDDRTYLRIEI